MQKELEEISWENIPDVESGSGIDLTEFTGQRKKIENIRVLEVESSFDENGVFNDKNKRKVKVLRIETETVTKITNKEGQEVPVRASELFNMKQNDEGAWGISTNEKAKIRKFMRRQKASSLKALIGTVVLLKDITDKKTGSTYLSFVVE